MLVNKLSFSFKFANQIKLSILVLLSVLMISCETVRYYSQAARGHLSLVFDRENIQRLLARPDIPAELRDKFNQVLLIRLSKIIIPLMSTWGESTPFGMSLRQRNFRQIL